MENLHQRLSNDQSLTLFVVRRVVFAQSGCGLQEAKAPLLLDAVTFSRCDGERRFYVGRNFAILINGRLFN